MQTVISKDGTKIAYEKVGEGPTAIFVTGATGSRNDPYSSQVAQLLSSDFSAIYYDRRGRGDSTDTKPFSVKKEVEDIEAIIDAEGGSAYLYGLSSGGALALEATIALKDKVKKLAIYEVPYDESESGMKAWHEYTATVSKAIEENRRGDAIAAFMKLLGVPDEMLAGMRQAPFWAGMEAVAPTLLYDAAALGEDRLVPRERVKDVTTPTLIIDGGGSRESMPFMSVSGDALAKALPHAERQTLEGQTHDVDMKVLAPVLIKFFKA